MAKKTEIKDEITIPDNVEMSIDNDILTIKGEKGTISKIFSHPIININIKDKKVVITCKNPRKKNKALVGTFIAHINNMIKGVSEEFEYSMFFNKGAENPLPKEFLQKMCSSGEKIKYVS